MKPNIGIYSYGIFFYLLILVLPNAGTVSTRLSLLALCLITSICLVSINKINIAEIPFKLSILIWILVCGFSITYAIDLPSTLKELKNEISYCLAGFFAFYTLVVTRPVFAKILIFVIVISVFLQSSWASIWYIYNNFTWIELKYFHGVGLFTTHIITALPFLLLALFITSNKILKWFCVFTLLFVLYVLFISKQRLIWPVVLFQTGAFLLLSWRFKLLKINNKKFLIIFSGLTVTLISLFCYVSYIRSPESFIFQDVRYPFFINIIKTIYEHPLYGYGFGINNTNMSTIYPHLRPPEIGTLWHAHNIELNYGLQMGVPGIIAVLFLFYSILQHFWIKLMKNPNWISIAGIALVGGVFLRNQLNDFFVRDASIAFWVYLGILSGLLYHSSKDYLSPINKLN